MYIHVHVMYNNIMHIYTCTIVLLFFLCRSYTNCSLSAVPENHSHSPCSTRRDKLLAVRTMFQKVYRTAVPEVQPQGAMAFATGLLSRLPLFGNNYTSV